MSGATVALDVRTASAHFPGIGRYAVNLARAVASRAGGPRVLLVHGPSPDRRLPLSLVEGVECGASPFGVRQQWEVPGLLRSSGARVYHSPYYVMPFRPGVATVVTCYDMIPLTLRGAFAPARRIAFRAAHALAFRASDAVIVPSTATRDDVARLFPRTVPKIEVVPLGWEFAPSDAGDTEPIAHRPPLPERYVLAVGSNKPHKNLRVLADAWAAIVARRRDAAFPSLVLAGPRDARYDEGGASADRLRRDGRLVSLGPVSDTRLAELYRGATLAVCPSLAEGFGLPVAEAMGFGTPVACSRIPALVELAGEAAATFEPRDADALGRLLERLVDSPVEREAMSRAGLERAAAFTWERAASATSEIYARLAGGRA